MKWIEVLEPVPVYSAGSSIEFVALPGMSFKWISKDEIIDLDYSSKSLYIDLRFCRFVEKPTERKPVKLVASELLQHMEKRLGTPYVWGGNWAPGVPEVLPPGLDCSGLLFEATNGTTPRNTSALVLYGKPLENDDFLPMDMIVYPGHVLFVRDQETIIESKSPMGVRICPIQERLAEIREERTFVRDWSHETNAAHSFTIRRIC